MFWLFFLPVSKHWQVRIEWSKIFKHVGINGIDLVKQSGLRHSLSLILHDVMHVANVLKCSYSEDLVVGFLVILVNASLKS